MNLTIHQYLILYINKLIFNLKILIDFIFYKQSKYKMLK